MASNLQQVRKQPSVCPTPKSFKCAHFPICTFDLPVVGTIEAKLEKLPGSPYSLIPPDCLPLNTPLNLCGSFSQE